MLRTFSKGIHPKGYKELTENLPITVMNTPSRVYILVDSKKDPDIFVKKGDEVCAGTLLAKGNVNVFSSCSGIVLDIVKRRAINGVLKTHVVIENDNRNLSVTLPILSEPMPDEILQRIIEAGIIGMGGAGFPTGTKLNQNKKIEYLLINGAECEPYINCDNRLMIEHTKSVIEGSILLKEAAKAHSLIIAVEDNKPEAIKRLKKAAEEYANITVHVLKTKYPQGDARRLINSVLGIKIPQYKRTTDYGVMVNNIHTAYAVYQSIKEGIPSYSRIITVSGKGIKKPGNYLVSNGTLYTDLIEFCGGYDIDSTVRIIGGGPMMGRALLDSEYSTTSASGSLLLLTPPETIVRNSSACINCGKCAKVCPANIMPMYIDLYTRIEDYKTAKKYGAEFCIECGCCAYICPAKRTLVTSMKQAKMTLAVMKKGEESK